METENIVYGIEDLLKILPHRYPFLLLDKVTSITEGPEGKNRVGRKIIAIKNVTFNEPFFQGHFPHRPVMPGVLQLEALAQAGAIAAYREEDGKPDVAIVGVNNAKFRRPVVPGDSLEIHADVIRDRGSMVACSSYAFVNGKKVVEAEILAKVFPYQGAER